MSESESGSNRGFLRKHVLVFVFTVLGSVLPTVILYHLGYQRNASEQSAPQLPLQKQPVGPMATQADPPGSKPHKRLEEKKTSSSDADRFVE